MDDPVRPAREEFPWLRSVEEYVQGGMWERSEATRALDKIDRLSREVESLERRNEVQRLALDLEAAVRSDRIAGAKPLAPPPPHRPSQGEP